MNAEYIDDPTILDADTLWRRIHPDQYIFDEILGRLRPTSAAFGDHRNGTPMSVILGNEVTRAGRTAESVLEGMDGFSLAAITARDARSVGQGITRKPEPEEPAHAEVFGKKTRAVKFFLCTSAQWIIPPAQTET